MRSQLLFLMLIASSLAFAQQDDSYPPPYGDNMDSCSQKGDKLIPLSTELYGSERIFDITHKITSETLTGHPEGVVDHLTLYAGMKNGSIHNFSIIKLPAHVGTHVDAPGHMFESFFDAGFNVDSLDLDVLNVPSVLVDVPRNKNITAEVMKSLNIPKGVRRVLFRTLNTDREQSFKFRGLICYTRLMWKKELDLSFVGFTLDGALWLKDNTDIKLVGLDYLSVGALRLVGAEGCPIRCILIK